MPSGVYLRTENARKKMSQAGKGRIFSKEHKDKISEANRGRIYSIETRIKLSKLNRGNKSRFWKGGVTAINKLIRTSSKYKLWRKAIYERDNYTCQICKIRGIKLNADHVKMFSVILFENKIKNINDSIKCKELWNLDNGRTLCHSCHEETDTYGRRIK